MIGSLVTLAIYLIVLGLVVWLLLYALSQIPMAQPFEQIARMVIIVGACLIAIFLLLGFIGVDTGVPKLR